jgi:hypothetical protein
MLNRRYERLRLVDAVSSILRPAQKSTKVDVHISVRKRQSHHE